MARGDMFLKIEGKSGPIKGEAQDSAHAEEIEIMSWTWGMQARTAMSAAGDATKATVDELDVTKYVDAASTALMASIRNNEPIKKATLTVRKAGAAHGKQQMEYVRITLDDARITGFSIQSTEPELSERVTFAFKKIKFEYRVQLANGAGGGTSTFATEIK